ncbi:ribosome biogenesis GTPase YqeH [Thalassorhabdus alkalitolerans]|uniref:Ribosome biogenesis GTPase YqeH n=1 Tax=Thalassorhabdus alkalitolerans TaxID=2282697 RepID=A0ABW0YNY8_9BACI|nr:ribosome biogenesis GTPase YqeH [Thalassobacillus sp. C254]
MSEQEIVCTGCGVTIQTEDKQGMGYTPPSALERDTITCQRCFRLKHYNEVQDVPLTDDDFLAILNQLGQTDALIVKIVDIFDFNGSWLPGLHRFVGDNQVLLVGNKADLLPKSVKQNKVIQWMKKSAKELGLKPADVMLMSAEKKYDIDKVAEAIEQYRKNRDVYIVGCTNVGKSTFINSLIKQFGGEEEELITTSHFPGTTLDMIDIPLEDGKSLFDTPGIINHHQMAHFVSQKELKEITPRKEIKPKIFQLNEGQTLYAGGMARLDFLQGERNSFVCYFANDLSIHRTKTEKADELYENHLGDMLSPPGKETAKEFPPLKRQEITVKEEKTDVVISGLGWINVSEAGAKIAVYVPEGSHVTIREGII